MLVPALKLARYLEQKPDKQSDPLVVSPLPDLEGLKAGGASIDLRLGTWFVTMKARRMALLDIYDDDSAAPDESELTSKYYIPFGEKFILHPKSFVLAVTLEWLRMPLGLAGMVTGKSSWGRRGLVIETAPGVHPGTEICQLFVHQLETNVSDTPKSKFFGQRQPMLSKIVPDDFAKNLMQ